MKKILILAIALLLVKWGFSQGTTPPAATPPATTTQAAGTTPTVTLFGSYVALGDILVHPFKENTQDPGKASNQTTDYTIHFHIKKGDKFTIEKIMSSNNSVTGYVIKPWRYQDADGKRKHFYDSVFNAQKTSAAVTGTTKADLEQQKNSINATIADTLAAAKKVDSLKSQLTAITPLVSQTKQQLVTTALNADATKALVTPQAAQGKNRAVDPNVTSFQTAQNNLKASPTSEQLKNDFMTVIRKLPPTLVADTSLANSRAEYNAMEKKSSSLKTDLDKATADLKSKMNNLATLKAAYQDASMGYNSGQDGNPPPDSNSYKATKQQSGENMDTPSDPTSQYALYDQFEYLDCWANKLSFFISATDLANANTIFTRTNSFTWGFLTLPIKVRFDNSLPNGTPSGGRFNFEQNLNFGLTFGMKHQMARTSDISWNYLAGISVVTVPLQNASTTTTPPTPATSTAALSISGGVMFQYDKFQIGVFLGTDLAGSNANQFAYQSRQWIGIAIGLSLFGEGQTKAPVTPAQ